MGTGQYYPVPWAHRFFILTSPPMGDTGGRAPWKELMGARSRRLSGSLEVEEVDVIMDPDAVVDTGVVRRADRRAGDAKKRRGSRRSSDLRFVVIAFGDPLLTFDLRHVERSRSVDEVVLAARGNDESIGVLHRIDVANSFPLDGDSIIGVPDLERTCSDVRSVGSRPAQFDSSSRHAVAIVNGGELIEVQRLESLGTDSWIEDVVETKNVLGAVRVLRGARGDRSEIRERQSSVHGPRIRRRVERHVTVASDVLHRAIPRRGDGTTNATLRHSPAGRSHAPTKTTKKSRREKPAAELRGSSKRLRSEEWPGHFFEKKTA